MIRGLPKRGLYWTPDEPGAVHVEGCTGKIVPPYRACHCGTVRRPPETWSIRVVVLSVPGREPLVLRMEGDAAAIAAMRPGFESSSWDDQACGGYEIEPPPGPGLWVYSGRMTLGWCDERDDERQWHATADERLWHTIAWAGEWAEIEWATS